MTKKLILLIIALPLFLMICLFTATSGISLAVPIGVSGIELLSESTVYLDIDKKETHQVEYAIYPTNAANQEVTFTYLPLEDENGNEQTLAKFEYDEETGILKPLAPGAAEVVITTVDGGYRARFVAIVDTRELISIKSTPPNLAASFDETLGMEKYDLAPGDTFKIQNDFYPETAANLLVEYSSSDTSVATVNSRGVVQARGAGTTIITVSSRANSYINYSFALDIANPIDQDFVIVDKNIVTPDVQGEINLSITTEEDYTISYDVVDKDGNTIENANHYILLDYASDSTGNYISYIIDPGYYGTLFIDVTLTLTESGESTTLRCSVSRIELSDDPQIIFDNDKDYYDVYLQKNEIYFQIYPMSESWDVMFNVTTDNNNIIIYGGEVHDAGDGYYSIIVDPMYVGVSTVTIEATYRIPGEDEDKVIVASIPVVVKPNRILAQNSVGENKAYGIEESYTIGKYNADGTLYNHTINYNIQETTGTNFYDNVKWVSSSDAVYVDENGKIVFVEGKEIADFVTFTVKYYCGTNEVMSSQAVKIRCVSNGYNVHSYKELLEITRAGKVVVLQKDIVHDFGVDVEKSGDIYNEDRSKKNLVFLPEDQIYTTMKSTYDITWYEKSGLENLAYIKVLISFTDDVYGNGHKINADNVVSHGQWEAVSESGQTQLKDWAFFRGPLNFVGLGGDGGINTGISVAAQDNVCFAAFEGVALNNIDLIGRIMDAYEDGTQNLQSLHYAGTVVEVFGDDVSIEYSRVSNGRNVVRAFGDYQDPNKTINLTVTNSVLSNGRDFIMRLGTNKFVEGQIKDYNNYNDPTCLSPIIPDGNPNDRVNFENRHNYDNFTDDEKSLYDTQYIRTHVTLKNSVLEDPGIFGIGVDSHFAGAALEDGSIIEDKLGEAGKGLFTGWKNLAKTSYGVKLTLAGDVRMYCWKVLDTVDSSSLIEFKTDIDIAGLINKDTLAFNLPKLVRDAVSGSDRLANAVYNSEVEAKVKNGEGTWKSIWSSQKALQQYDKVHAGIAFFGGGKNYGVIEYDNFEFYKFSKPYEIGFADTGMEYLNLAAGVEDFYFIIYDSTTRNFLYETQDEMRKNPDEAHSCIYKK